MVERACFDAVSSTLTLSFKGGGKYVYDDVPPEVFDLLCQTPSAGSFVNAHIKGKYRCRRDPERRRFCPDANAYI
jgi:hypothetical protein